jgi:hypothetical protein
MSLPGSQEPERFAGKNRTVAKRFAGNCEVALIECHQQIRLSVHSSFKHHIVVRIGQLRPPRKPDLDRTGYLHERAEGKIFVFP